MFLIVLPIVKKIISSIIGLLLTYLLITGILGITFGVKTPQFAYNEKPYTTILSDQNASKSYTKEVKPGEIQSLLDNHNFSQEYQEGVFDCSDMSREVARYLKSEGYHTSVIGDDAKEHAWAFVWNNQDSGWAIETTVVSGLKGGSGEVVGDDWYDFHFVLDSMFTGKIYELYYPSVDRGGLHILDWDDPELDKR